MIHLGQTSHLESSANLVDWLQLIRSENIGPLTFLNLLKRYGTVEQALKALPDLAVQGGLRRPLKIASRLEIEREIEKARQFGAHLLTLEDPRYPPLLRHIESAPPVLTVKGNLDLLQKSCLAIVGARNASAMGKKLASKFASELGREEWIISSGLARGIDRAAHQASLETGTIAVLAGGIDHIYPEENTDLYHIIAEKGLLVAESSFGLPPQASLFPRRNRIISGLSKGVLVVEAALKSGSLLTATHALEQGREVFAIPGHPLDPRAQGCNKLIKNGAPLVETPQDIMQAMGTSSLPSSSAQILEFQDPPSPLELGKIRKLIRETLSFVPINVDEVIRECQLQASDVSCILLELEIAGCLERHPGGKVSLKEDWKSK